MNWDDLAPPDWICICGISNSNSKKMCDGCGLTYEKSEESKKADEKQRKISNIPRISGTKEYILLAPSEGFQRTFNGEALQYMLNKYASEGWRLVSATPMAGLKPMSQGIGALGAIFLGPLVAGALGYAEEKTWTMVFILERDIK